jgi:SAM-dependent methyltransferase
MHDTALASGVAFSEVYGRPGMLVVDIGGKNVNGSLRQTFESAGMTFVSVDMEEHPSVDVVVKPGEKLPFGDGTVDLVVSSSCFEHDPCFWMTIREMARITKLGGFVYVSAPSGGPYHGYPGDNWRFYKDSAYALAFWSCHKLHSEDVVFPLMVEETFTICVPNWRDRVSIWRRTNETTEEFHAPAKAGERREAPARKMITGRWFPTDD